MPSKTKKVAILQSNYIPWRGYFDIIKKVDEFIIYDDCQYTIRDWRNRNLIKTNIGTEWITIPVEVRNKYHQKIRDTKIANPNWQKLHWKKIFFNYSKASYFKEYKHLLEDLYLSATEKFLSEINLKFIKAVCKILSINTTITSSHDYDFDDKDNTLKLINLCTRAKASQYISGPAAKNYINEKLFKKSGIKLIWMKYNYPEYPQLYPPFNGNVTVLDLILNTGKNAPSYI